MRNPITLISLKGLMSPPSYSSSFFYSRHFKEFLSWERIDLNKTTPSLHTSYHTSTTNRPNCPKWGKWSGIPPQTKLWVHVSLFRYFSFWFHWPARLALRFELYLAGPTCIGELHTLLNDHTKCFWEWAHLKLLANSHHLMFRKLHLCCTFHLLFRICCNLPLSPYIH